MEADQVKAKVLGHRGLDVVVQSVEDGTVYVLASPEGTTSADLDKYFPVGEFCEFEKHPESVQ
jgi:hypothetical protein